MLGPPREFVIHSFGTSTEMGLTNPRGAPSTKGTLCDNVQKQMQTDKRACVQKCVQKYVQKHVQKCVQQEVQQFVQKVVQNRVQNRVQKPVQKYVQNSVQKYVLSVQKAGGAVPKAVPEERSRTNDFVENCCILQVI
jgi:histone H3/H4